MIQIYKIMSDTRVGEQGMTVQSLLSEAAEEVKQK